MAGWHDFRLKASESLRYTQITNRRNAMGLRNMCVLTQTSSKGLLRRTRTHEVPVIA
jgi:hypothetical protein